jgi:hypothetical protein
LLLWPCLISQIFRKSRSSSSVYWLSSYASLAHLLVSTISSTLKKCLYQRKPRLKIKSTKTLLTEETWRSHPLKQRSNSKMRSLRMHSRWHRSSLGKKSMKKLRSRSWRMQRHLWKRITRWHGKTGWLRDHSTSMV